MLNNIGSKEEYLLKYGIKSVMMISESSMNNRLIIKFIDGTELYYDIIDNVDNIYDKVDEVIHNIIIKRRIDNIRKIKDRICLKKMI